MEIQSSLSSGTMTMVAELLLYPFCESSSTNNSVNEKLGLSRIGKSFDTTFVTLLLRLALGRKVSVTVALSSEIILAIPFSPIFRSSCRRSSFRNEPVVRSTS